MRLMSKYYRYSIAYSLGILLIGGICYTMITRWILIRQLNQDLIQEKEEIVASITKKNMLPDPMSFKGQTVRFVRVRDSFAEQISNEYHFVKVPHKKRSRFRIFRTLVFPVALNGNIYQATIIRSQAETEDLIRLLAGCTFILVLLLLWGFGLLNRLLLNKLWLPFHKTLFQLEKFKLSERRNIRLETTDIQEFAALNKAVSGMTVQAEKEYIALKDFTENASHEIQTPLAIIKSKLELLMQSELLQKEESENIVIAYEATVRLSKLNAALLLLTRIENKQYDHSEDVPLVPVLNRLLVQYEDLIRAGNITLRSDIGGNPVIQMDESLSEILIGNLIRNAIRHNIENGFIAITVSDDKIIIVNSGPVVHGPAENMFNRFQKESLSSKSLGLGLSIVKKIVDQYGFAIQYQYSNGVHTIELTLNE